MSQASGTESLVHDAQNAGVAMLLREWHGGILVCLHVALRWVEESTQGYVRIAGCGGDSPPAAQPCEALLRQLIPDWPLVP